MNREEKETERTIFLVLGLIVAFILLIWQGPMLPNLGTLIRYLL